MDPSYASSDDEAEAMAKQMGFSSFGAQGPPKKRKFNPATDAMVEGQELVSLNRGGKKGQGSGGNMIPLGKPRVMGVAPPANEDEIALDDEDEEDGGPAYIDTSLPPPQEQEADRSAFTPGETAWIAQQKIDAILAGNQAPTIPPESKGKDKPHFSEAGRGVSQFISALQEAPRPPTAATTTSTTTSGSFTGSQQPRERGQRNPLWYVDYLDPSFIENPWASLEKANGLRV
jgi:hypothetical protein